MTAIEDLVLGCGLMLEKSCVCLLGDGCVVVVIFWLQFTRWGGGGHFRSKKFRCKFSAGRRDFGKNRNIFPKKGRGGGGQRPFGIFPKKHPLWRIRTSLPFMTGVDYILF